ncbi:CHAP domain-containing protein [Tsuneonella sp. SYSU-LHT278]|uniref:CHAP domain-containing protein n=1 Tax=Tsuneonella sediminis TaxID=3416089 RepID=UPI003F799A02
MRGPLGIAVGALALALPGMARADIAAGDGAARSAELPAYLQCVPFARERTGVQIYGDARTWWEQAEGRYQRGNRPRTGAVMTFLPHGSMTLGHVAAVAQVIDSRTVLLDHANWSPIDGRRGQVERGVRAIDVSPGNDWSQVRVWYAPLGDLGTTAWPVAGFIYNEPERKGPYGGERILAAARQSPTPSAEPSKAFAMAFSGLGEARVATPSSARQAARPATRTDGARIAATAGSRPRDPIDAAIARYGS